MDAPDYINLVVCVWSVERTVLGVVKYSQLIVASFFFLSRLLPLSAGWSLLFMSIKADLLHYFSNWMSDADVISHITPDIILPLSLCSSPCLLLCVTSPQGEASQYPPTGGRLWDQKGVLPLPWTVSSDVWWVEGGGGKGSLPVSAAARVGELNVLIIDSWGMSCCSLGPARYENSSELHSFGIQIWLLSSGGGSIQILSPHCKRYLVTSKSLHWKWNLG